MTSDIKMLPLPEADDSVENHAQWPIVIYSDVWLQESVQDYARAVAEHNVAARDAEIEKLKTEVAEWKASYQQAADDCIEHANRADQLQAELDNRWAQGVHTCHDKCQRIACVLRRERDFELKRAERLAEALRLIASPKRPDGTWNRDREACRQIAAEALRDHDQEGKDG